MYTSGVQRQTGVTYGGNTSNVVQSNVVNAGNNYAYQSGVNKQIGNTVTYPGNNNLAYQQGGATIY